MCLALFDEFDLLLGQAVEAVDDLVDEVIGEAQALLDGLELGEAPLVGVAELGQELVGELAADSALVLLEDLPELFERELGLLSLVVAEVILELSLSS